jgi:hypothetical protein
VRVRARFTAGAVVGCAHEEHQYGEDGGGRARAREP